MSVLYQHQKVIAHPVRVRLDQLERQNLGIHNTFTDMTYENSLIEISDAIGILAGHVATIDPNTDEYIVCDVPNMYPMGLFGQTSSKEITGKRYPDEVRTLTLVSGGVHEVDTYETHDHNQYGVVLEYRAGDLLFCSPYGLLTNIVSDVGHRRAIAVVVRPPKASNHYMQIRLFEFASGVDQETHPPVTIATGSSPFLAVTSNQELSIRTGTDAGSLALGNHTHEFDLVDIGGLPEAIQGIYNQFTTFQVSVSQVAGLQETLVSLQGQVSIGSPSSSDCCEDLRALLNKLLPKPPKLSITENYNWIQAKMNNTGVVTERVTLDRRPGFLIHNLYDGRSGVLEAFVSRNNGLFSPAGSLDLSITGALDDGFLSLGEYQDSYLGIDGKEDFYYERNGALKPNTNLTYFNDSLNLYRFKLEHTEPEEFTVGVSIFGDTHIDTKSGVVALQPDFTRITGMDTSSPSAIRLVSGVPFYTQFASVVVQALLRYAVSNFYHKDKVLTISGDGVVDVDFQPQFVPTTFGQNLSFEGVLVSIADNYFTSDLSVTFTGRNAYDDVGVLTVNYATPIRINSLPLNTDRVKSGFNEFPNLGAGPTLYGDPYDYTESLLVNQELLDYGGRIMYPNHNFSLTLPPGPNYLGMTGMRWYTIKFTNFEGTGVDVRFVNTQGNWSGQDFTQGAKLYIRVEGERETGFWVNGYTSYVGFGPIANSSQGGLLKTAATTDTVKAVTFGEGDSKKGTLYVRFGMLPSDNKNFNAINIVPRI